MPSWTTEDGTNLFGKKACPRCLHWLTTTKTGDLPNHKCLGGELRDGKFYPLPKGNDND